MRIVAAIIAVLLTVSLTAPSWGWEQARQMGDIAAAESRLAAADAQLRLRQRMLDLLTDRARWGDDARARSAVAALEDAQRKQYTALSDAGLAELKSQLEAAQQARGTAVEALLITSPRVVVARQTVEALRKEADALLAKPADDAALQKAAELHIQADALERPLHAAARALWKRAEVADAYAKADALYKEYNKKAGGNDALQTAAKAVKDAQRDLDAAAVAAVAATPQGKALAQSIEEATRQRQTAQEQLDTARAAVIGTKPWTASVDVAQPPGKDGKPRKAAKANLWIPPGTNTVRGIIMGHPPQLGTSVPNNPTIRLIAAQCDLAILNFEQLDALFTYTGDAPQRLEKALADLAASTKRPELTRVPYLTVGHSTSGIYARNVAYWKPERTIAVIHIKSGNMHQHKPDPARTLDGVPFLAINGEFEEFGPEGGIRPDYGMQTQWVMIREQLLRLRRANPNHLMSLVVHPGGGHGDWSPELTNLCAQFIYDAARKRLPVTPPAEGPITCQPLKAEDGWLTDADLTTPQHAPAPYAQYAGDKSEAFWHLTETMAKGISIYHQNRLLLNDPTREHPVPKSWPPAPKP